MYGSFHQVPKITRQQTHMLQHSPYSLDLKLLSGQKEEEVVRVRPGWKEGEAGLEVFQAIYELLG